MAGGKGRPEKKSITAKRCVQPEKRKRKQPRCPKTGNKKTRQKGPTESLWPTGKSVYRMGQAGRKKKRTRHSAGGRRGRGKRNSFALDEKATLIRLRLLKERTSKRCRSKRKEEERTNSRPVVGGKKNTLRSCLGIKGKPHGKIRRYPAWKTLRAAGGGRGTQLRREETGKEPSISTAAKKTYFHQMGRVKKRTDYGFADQVAKPYLSDQKERDQLRGTRVAAVRSQKDGKETGKHTT